MKTIKKDILKVVNIASKRSVCPILSCVLVNKEKMVATDRYILLEIPREGSPIDEFPIVEGQTPLRKMETPILLSAKELKNQKFYKKQSISILEEGLFTNETEKTISLVTTNLIKTNEIVYQKIAGTFPTYSQIIPNEPPIGQIDIDAKLLRKLLKAFEDKDENRVTLNFYGENKPLLLQNKKDYKGMIMPLKK